VNKNDFRLKLLEQDTIYINGKIDGEMAEYVGEALAYISTKGTPPVSLYISSGGGSVSAGLDIHDMLRFYPENVTGVVVGYARSMAAVILQACNQRMALEHSRILIHHISRSEVTLDVLRSGNRLKKLVADMEREQNYLYKILAGRSKRSVREIRKTCTENRDMSADEALRFGLIDQIAPKRAIEGIAMPTID
jgi:ATP-dependent Clp protease protease subunit